MLPFLLFFSVVLRHPTAADVPAANAVPEVWLVGLFAGDTSPKVCRLQLRVVAVQLLLLV